MDREFLEGLGMDAQAVDAVLQAHEKVLQAHGEQVAALKLEHQVSEAVHLAGGRNVKAISALLDLDSIAGSEDPASALEAALSQLKKDSGYLFYTERPPRYAPFTGAQEPAAPQKNTLAGALRERMTRK